MALKYCPISFKVDRTICLMNMIYIYIHNYDFIHKCIIIFCLLYLRIKAFSESTHQTVQNINIRDVYTMFHHICRNRVTNTLYQIPNNFSQFFFSHAHHSPCHSFKATSALLLNSHFLKSIWYNHSLGTNTCQVIKKSIFWQ